MANQQALNELLDSVDKATSKRERLNKIKRLKALAALNPLGSLHIQPLEASHHSSLNVEGNYFES